ncbi:MAG: cytochrome c5 family protein [Rhizobiaceae bacterium]|nr:cytochrome c5 family protein [Rhizobiaceae bacterium]
MHVAARPQPVTEHAPSTAAIYSQFCASCHDDGQYGAPVRGNIEDWDRFPRDRRQLLELAIAGNKAMIPRGGCADCSDEQLLELIEFVIPQSWAEQ